MKTSNRDVVALAIGRIMRLASRPSVDVAADLAEFDRCRAIIMEHSGKEPSFDARPNYARDRRRGAAGD
jgi:hypothetical protein